MFIYVNYFLLRVHMSNIFIASSYVKYFCFEFICFYWEFICQIFFVGSSNIFFFKYFCFKLIQIFQIFLLEIHMSIIFLWHRHIYTRPSRQLAGRPDAHAPLSVMLNDLLAVKKAVFCQKK